MLYAILKLLFRITFKVFFRKAVMHRLENIPKEGPLLICANHPGAFLDPIIVAVLMNRPIHFLAKGVVFKTKFAQWLFPKFNMIPIYRKQDDPSMMHKNKETFEKCYEHLGKGGAIIIFPEGISITERKLRPIKTGAARIALGAEETYNYSLGLKIITIGLNYQDPHSFRQDVFVNVGEPIVANDYVESWKKDSFVAADELTEEIRKRMETQIIITENETSDELVAQVERLYKDKLKAFHGIDPKDSVKDFKASQRISQVVHWYLENDHARAGRIADHVRSYFWKLDALGLNDGTVAVADKKSTVFRKGLMDLVIAVLGFPVFIYGFIHNYFPFALAAWLSKKVAKVREFRGAVAAAAGMFLFLIWHLVLGILAWKFTHHLLFTLLYIASWIPSGLLAYLWYRVVWRMSRKWVLLSIFSKRSKLINELVYQRALLIEEFEIAASEFRAAEAAGTTGTTTNPLTEGI
jgi:glycerol-3-phosphate O-acyltransferase / dihydroxyacetone phosphate acyltransferase